MKLDVTQALRNPGEEFPFEAEQAIAAQEVSGETVTFDPALMKGVYSATEDGSVTLDGVLTTVAHARCANCLSPAQADIQAAFRETFYHDGEPETDDRFAYEGSAVELERLAMFTAMLELPMRFLCREDCPGLGEFAGKDVYTRSSQEELPGQHPFAALQQLLTEKSQEND